MQSSVPVQHKSHAFDSVHVINARCGNIAGNEQCSEAQHVLDNIQAAPVVVRFNGNCLQRLSAIADVHSNMD